MNKKLILITASLATGLLGSLIIKKHKQPNLSPNDVFIGKWYNSKKIKLLSSIEANLPS